MDNQTFTQCHMSAKQFYKFHHYYYGQPIDISIYNHSFYEIYMFISGNISYVIEGYTYHPSPGDILLINHNETHHLDTLPLSLPCECIIFWLDESFFHRLHEIGEDLTACFRDASQRNCHLFRPSKAQITKIWNVCKTIEREYQNHELGNHIIAYSSMVELLVLLNRAYYDIPNSTYKNTAKQEQLNLIIAYINEHLSENLTLDQIAEQFHISKYYLSHQFKEYTGLSPYQYIMKKRLARAYHMIHNGKNITYACMESGFRDYSNFLKAFKREYGKNPSELTKYSFLKM